MSDPLEQAVDDDIAKLEADIAAEEADEAAQLQAALDRNAALVAAIDALYALAHPAP